MRIRCRAVFLDAGGVIVLPARALTADALAQVGLEIDPAAVPAAHYRAVRTLDRDPALQSESNGYLRAFCNALGVQPDHVSSAVGALCDLADRDLSGRIVWSEEVPDALLTIDALMGAGISVLIVTNSDGHAAENLRDAGLCQRGPGRGVTVTDVIDSGLVGAAKPAPAIFLEALKRARVSASSVVHVGDSIHADVQGARASGIVPIHLDSARTCRGSDHRHIRTLKGIWRHIAS